MSRFSITIRIGKHAFNYWDNYVIYLKTLVSYTDSITTDRCAQVEKNWPACVKGVLLNFDGQLQWEQQRCSLSANDLNSAMCNESESSLLDAINQR